MEDDYVTKYNSRVHFRSSKLVDLVEQSFAEFGDLLDYIWKAPRLIDYENKLEQSKLDLYFPDRPDLAKIRWNRESKKLSMIFPYYIAVSNLYIALSMLEIYLLSLHKTIKGSLSIDEGGIKGQGSIRIFNYLRAAGIAVSSVDLYSQVQAALQIRNCLLHAGGLLADSRNDKEIRRIVSDMTYLSTQSRKTDSIYKVRIGLSSFGEQSRLLMTTQI